MASLLLDVLTTAAILYVVAAGLLIVSGVLKIINFAHGGFLTIGGYAALVATQLGISPWFGPVLALGGVLVAILQGTRLGLAALAGALITPLLSVDPLMGVPWLLNAFMLVLVSGTSLFSLLLACVVLGGAQVVVSTYGNPLFGALTIVVLAAILLRIRPAGFARV